MCLYQIASTHDELESFPGSTILPILASQQCQFRSLCTERGWSKNTLQWGVVAFTFLLAVQTQTDQYLLYWNEQDIQGFMKYDGRVYLFLFKQQWFCSQWDQPKYKKYVKKELWLLADRRMDNMFCPTLTAAHCLFNLCNSGDAEAHHEETLRCVCDNVAHVLSSLSSTVCFTCGCALVSIMMVWLDQYNQLTKISNSTNNQNQIPTKSLAKWTRDVVDNVRSQDGRRDAFVASINIKLQQSGCWLPIIKCLGSSSQPHRCLLQNRSTLNTEQQRID